MRDLVHCLELDRGELTEGPLTTPAVVGAFDPEHDGQAELLSAAPASTVEHVPLQQREERLHGGVVGTGPGAAHRADQAVVPQQANELPRAELATSVGVHHGATRTSELDRVAKGR